MAASETLTTLIDMGGDEAPRNRETRIMLTKTERQTVAAIIKARRCRALFRETPSDWYFGKAAIAVGCRRMGKAVPQPGTAQARLRNLAAKGIIHRVERNRALYAFTDLGLGIVFALEGEGVAL